jgi:hypothetical protein
MMVAVKNRLIALCGLVGCQGFFATDFLCAQDGASSDGQQALVQYRVAQQAVQANTSQISDQISKINQELKDNGASDLEVRDIDSVLKELGHVTNEDMAKVISLLQTAGDSNDGKLQATNLNAAYLGQQGVLAKITLIASKLQQKQTYERLEAEVQDLLKRQIGNIRLSNTVQKIGAMKRNEDWQMRGDAIQTQAGLEPRLNALLPELDLFVSKLPEADANSLKNDLAKIQFTAISVSAANASELTYHTSIDGNPAHGEDGDWPHAIQYENEIRDKLSALLVLIAMKDPDSALEQASDALDRAIADQQSTIDATNSKPDIKATADLSKQQDSLQDSTGALSAALSALAPDAVAPLGKATDAMGDSGNALRANNPDGSLGPQQSALAALKDAKEHLDKQIASRAQAPEGGMDAQDPLTAAASALSDASNSNADAKSALNQGSPQGEADAQTKLGNASSSLDKALFTGSLSDPAKQAVGDAKNAIKDAQNSVGQNQPKPAQGASDKAADAIARAQDEIRKQMELEAAANGNGSSTEGVGAGGLGWTPLQSGSTKISAGTGDGSMNIGYVHGNYGKAAQVTTQHLENREAISQMPDESIPPEYGGMVSQFYKNLADSSSSH